MKNTALFIVNSLGNGGAERVCINLSEELARQGLKVHIISIYKSNNQYNIKNKNIEHVSLGYNPRNPFDKLNCILFGYRRLNKLVDHVEDYSLITSHLPVANVITRKSIIGDRCIYVFHNTVKSTQFGIKSVYKRIMRIFFNGRKIVTVSEGIKNEAINEYGLTNCLIKTIYNPLNNDISLAKKISMNNKPYFVVVGRLNDQKRQDRAIKAFYSGSFYKKYDLVLCGEGKNRKKLQELSCRLGIEDSVKLIGWQKNVYDWIMNSDLLLCTSDYEGFPMNHIEALALGTKVVSANCNFGPSEILTGEYSSYLVNDIDSIDEYVDKINAAIKHYPKVKNNILAKCEPCSVVKEYLSFYRSCDD